MSLKDKSDTIPSHTKGRFNFMLIDDDDEGSFSMGNIFVNIILRKIQRISNVMSWSLSHYEGDETRRDEQHFALILCMLLQQRKLVIKLWVIVRDTGTDTVRKELFWNTPNGNEKKINKYRKNCQKLRVRLLKKTFYRSQLILFVFFQQNKFAPWMLQISPRKRWINAAVSLRRRAFN